MVLCVGLVGLDGDIEVARDDATGSSQGSDLVREIAVVAPIWVSVAQKLERSATLLVEGLHRILQPGSALAVSCIELSS